tara:strand:+ start:78 stop:1067 length:990 start_codon:yes stop_codon:yes gene_type:complete
MITIEKYNKTYFEQWDNFIKTSNNGTIFQTQKFINYHITRKFNDYSLIIKKNDEILCLLPGVIKKVDDYKIYYSHPGTSYGGLILKKDVTFQLINEIIKSLDDYLIKHQFKKIFLINSPCIYWCHEDHSLDYLLQWNKYKIKETYISHASNIGQSTKIDNLLSKRKKRYILNDNHLNDFIFKEACSNSEIEQFYLILIKAKKQFLTTPTHSLNELKKLKKLFNKKIEIFVSLLNDSVVGGVVIFHANKKTSLIFYNVVDPNVKDSQLSVLQLYNAMKICKNYGASVVDFGVSHTPEKTNPLDPKFSLIKFKEQFGSKGIKRIAFEKELR